MPFRRAVLTVALFASTGAVALSFFNGDAGRGSTPADLSKLNFARAIYESEGGMGEGYYGYRGRIWARWETDFPEGDDNLSLRLAQLTRINVNPVASARRLSAPDLGDFPFLYISDPGYMVLSSMEKVAFARYLANGGFVWVDDFWGDAEWAQFAGVMRDVLRGREWKVLTTEHPIFHGIFDFDEMPQIPAVDFAVPGGSTAEYGAGHKYPTGPMEVPQMRVWLDDSGRIMVLATHNTDIGDGWEREAYGEWYFETFSTKSFKLAVNIVSYAMTH